MQLGELVCCRDYNQVNWYMQNNIHSINRVVVLDDEYTNIPGAIQGSLLLPPPSALFALIDNNDYNQFRATYYKYLHVPDIDGFIMLLVTALFQNINIIFFFNTSDPSMFMDTLGNFLSVIYGVTAVPFEMTFEPHPPSINPQFIPGLLSKMLQYQYISQEEYNSYFTRQNNSPFEKFSIQ